MKLTMAALHPGVPGSQGVFLLEIRSMHERHAPDDTVARLIHARHTLLAGHDDCDSILDAVAAKLVELRKLRVRCNLLVLNYALC